ncbi:MAG TPA: 2Fe-2S iron-sulfur cluster-binding protein [Streptosporangiaceae bacterium]|nr:2Fe-2S iron-sulfur cluster-binding protein [Streptosporangiaceae bacterium]
MDEHEVFVDGVARRLTNDPLAGLAWWLRDGGVTAVKVGCEEGVCGACMVLIDGEPAPACVVPLARVPAGARIETAAGLADSAPGQALAAALRAREPFQCGFCAPGMAVSCVAWMREHGSLPDDRTALAELLTSHLCRCTGKLAIIDALLGVGVEDDEKA